MGCRRFTLRVLVAAAVAAVLAAPAAAQIGVSPPRLELTLADGRASGALRLFNFGAEPVEVQTTAHSWDLDESNEVRIVAPTEQSLDGWLIVNPLRFTIEPGRAQTVRLAVRARVEPTPGEHRAILYFEQLNAQRPGNQATFTVSFRLGVAVYAYAEPVVRQARVEEVRAGPSAMELDISSSGNAHVRADGAYAVWRAEAWPGADLAVMPGTGEDAVVPDGVVAAGSLPRTPVLPGTTRTLVEPIEPPLPAGEYVAWISGAVEGEPVDRVLRLTVPQAPEETAEAP